MSASPLRVGLIGYGLAGKVFHTPLYPHADIDLVAIASSNADKVHADHPGIQVHATASELFNNPDVELVVLASPSFTHAPLMLEALAAGKHVLSDKPFTATTAEADAVIAAAKRADRMVSCYQNRRYDADFLTLQQLISDGRLGEVHHYEANFDRFSPTLKSRWQETAGPGVGNHYDLGAHLIDQALHLFGMPDWVQGDVQRQRPGTSIIDRFHVRMGKGDLRINLNAGMLVHDHRLRYRVHGTEGSWTKSHLDPQEDQLRFLGVTPDDSAYGTEDESRHGTLTRRTDDAFTDTRIPTLRGDWPRIYREIRLAIREDRPPPVTASQARNTIAVIEAMLESSEMGCRMALSPNQDPT